MLLMPPRRTKSSTTKVTKPGIYLNDDDQSVTLVLRPKTKGAKPREVVLPEPTIEVFTQIHTASGRADESLPPIPQPATPGAPTSAEIAAINEAVRDRNKAIYGPEAPYANVLIEIVKLLTDGEETIELSEMQTSLMSGQAVREILDHYKVPFVGRADDLDSS